MQCYESLPKPWFLRQVVPLIFIVLKETFGNQTGEVAETNGRHLYNDKKFFFCLNLILSVVKESEGKS